MVTPLYSATNCRVAYQLNWSLSLFPRVPIPLPEIWLDGLKESCEADGVRILVFRDSSKGSPQFLVSTLPHVSPSSIVWSVKGRLQSILHPTIGKVFGRNYHITSVGSANYASLDSYLSKQTARHPVADGRFQVLLDQSQFHDTQVDLSVKQRSSHGEYLHNLHIVLECAAESFGSNIDFYHKSREMIVASCRKKSLLLSRIAFLMDHIHLSLGCPVTTSPEAVSLSLMNNLAYTQQMKDLFRHSYYVGTFGNYDRAAIWKNRLDENP